MFADLFGRGIGSALGGAWSMILAATGFLCWFVTWIACIFVGIWIAKEAGISKWIGGICGAFWFFGLAVLIAIWLIKILIRYVEAQEAQQKPPVPPEV